jgi:hypothetical protein
VPDLPFRVSDDDRHGRDSGAARGPTRHEMGGLEPAFRVYFWRPLRQNWASREFELSAADVVAVLAWAAEHAEDDETYTVHCVVEGADGTGLVRLAGTDPTRT